MDLTGAHVLVTGASRGIGRDIAVRAAGAGAVVTVLARSRDSLGAVADQIGGRALVADLGDPEQRRGVVERAEAELGPVDVLVNAAGVDGTGAVSSLSAQELETVLQVNLVAAAELCRQVLPGMLQRRRGRLVNVSSGFSTVLAAGMGPYCASKAGLSHFTGALRLELAGSGVGTTLVELGPVDTEMYGDILRHHLAGPALRRAVRLRAVVAVEPDAVAARVVAAVQQDRAHVVLPGRMRALLGLTWLPRRASQVFLSGLPRR